MTALQQRYGSGKCRSWDWIVSRFGSLSIIAINGIEYVNDTGQSWPRSEQPGSMLRTELGVMRFADLMLTVMGKETGRALVTGEIDGVPEAAALRNAYRSCLSDALAWSSEWPKCLTPADRELLCRRVAAFERALASSPSLLAAEYVASAVGMLHPDDFTLHAKANGLDKTEWGKRALARTRDFLKAMGHGEEQGRAARVPQAPIPIETRKPAGEGRSPIPPGPRPDGGHGAATPRDPR